MTFRRLDFPVTLTASGAGSVQIQNNNSAMLWTVRQLSLITSPTSQAVCVITTPTGIVDTAYFAGTGDVAGGDPPIYLQPADYLTLTWSLGPANGVGLCTCYLDEDPLV